MREHSVHHIKLTFIQSSLEGARGKPLCEREVPPKKLLTGRRERLAHHIKPTHIQSSLRGCGGTLSEREFPHITFSSLRKRESPRNITSHNKLIANKELPVYCPRRIVEKQAGNKNIQFFPITEAKNMQKEPFDKRPSFRFPYERIRIQKKTKGKSKK